MSSTLLAFIAGGLCALWLARLIGRWLRRAFWLLVLVAFLGLALGVTGTPAPARWMSLASRFLED